jgi:hypothetical protein
MPKLKCPENCDSASFDGVEYPAEDSGLIEVPDEAVAALMFHGFTAPTIAEVKAAKK